jgi:hypothetical protein
MLILSAIGMTLVNITLSSQQYGTILIITIITQIVVIGAYFYGFKSFGLNWRLIGGVLSLLASWAIVNSIVRLINA